MESVLLDAAGRRRSPATMPGFHAGRPPRNKGLRYPPDPPSVEEIIAVMRTAGDGAEGVRLRALIVVLWRAGLRISEALALAESDLDPVRGSVLVRHGKGGRAPRGRDGPLGMGAAAAVGGAARDASGGRFAVRIAWSDGRPAVGFVRCAEGAAGGGRPRRCPPAVRSAPAPACSRGRDGARGNSDHSHTAPARACRSGRDLRVFARD